MSSPIANPSSCWARFYPWFGHYNHWNLSSRQPPLSWASEYLPSVSAQTNEPARALYDSNDTDVILWQLGKMRQAGLDFAISSWWGRSTYDDKVLQKIIFGVMPRNDNPYPDLRWSIVYEKVRFSDPSVEEIVQDLQYLKATFGGSSSILRIGGRMVLFVAGAPGNTSQYVDKWSEAVNRVGDIYLVLKAFGGYGAFASKADAWYQFAPGNRMQFDSYYWGYVSPGYWMYNESAPRLVRSPTEFAKALQTLRESNVQLVLIETWNDWNEGSQIEPGRDIASGSAYGDTYVDLVRQVMKENMQPSSNQALAMLGGIFSTIALVLVMFPALHRRRKSVGASDRATH